MNLSGGLPQGDCSFCPMIEGITAAVVSTLAQSTNVPGVGHVPLVNRRQEISGK